MTRDDLLAALLIERFGPDAQVREARGDLIDDLPPDIRPWPIIVVRGRP